MGILGGILAYLGNLNFASGKLAEAEAFYKKAVKRKAGNGLPYLNYAILLLGQGGRTADAIDLLEKSLTVKKRSALTEKNIYITRVTAFWLHGDLDRATDA
ncbi:MAG: tetratricopeptide repeat protein, partial [Oscillospiraceae bacterium]|nr:tetratricopeptide repeat protein [Oscillospiraceae bacterium]